MCMGGEGLLVHQPQIQSASVLRFSWLFPARLAACDPPGLAEESKPSSPAQKDPAIPKNSQTWGFQSQKTQPRPRPRLNSQPQGATVCCYFSGLRSILNIFGLDN